VRLITFSAGSGSTRLGAVLGGDRVLDLTSAGRGNPALRSMLDLIDGGPEALRVAREVEARAGRGDGALAPHLRPLGEVSVHAPIPRPRKNVICVGLNYRSHVEQNARALGMKFELPPIPLFFSKPVTSVIGPGEPIIHDERLTQKLDYEVELGVVIGRRGSWIPEGQAMDYVFGYTLANDISARDLQFRTSQFFIGKGLDSYCPVGPAIVDRESLPDPGRIELQLLVNGEMRQREAAGHMLFSIPAVLAELSRGMTLEPGDILSTGTPGGCGYQLVPPRFLRPGDVVECRADPIGVLANPVRAAVAVASREGER
jgi:2-keto-4-pentenoate hydratase/2-oxohepta-3-ene-1,7-dioic acid hydratase in catechol pathway